MQARHTYFARGRIANAAYLTAVPGVPLYVLGNACSISLGDFNLHLSPGLGYGDQHGEFVSMEGVSYRWSESMQLMAEHLYSTRFEDEDCNNFLLFSWRWRRSKVAWDFGGFRPLNGSGELLLLPYFRVTWFWGK